MPHAPRVPGIFLFISILTITAAGFAAKFYQGPGASWFQDYGAAVCYEIFWILIFSLFWQNHRAIPWLVFGVTCALEFLQLWNPAPLAAIRSTFIGSALIGTTFVWWDFPHYALGCLLGGFWLGGLDKISDKHSK